MRLDWRIVLKAFAGFVLGLALWLGLSPVYSGFVAWGAEKVLHVFENPKVTRLTVEDDNYATVDRRDFGPGSKRPALPVNDLTFNFILLTALFGASRRVFTDRNVAGFIGASLSLAVTHILALIVGVEKVYSSQLGLWSKVNYTELQRNIWLVSDHAYRVVLMYAIAFALWWIFRDSREETLKKPAVARKKKK